MPKRKNYLDKQILLHVTQDGTLYYRVRDERVFSKTRIKDNGWRDVAADAVREGRIDEALNIIGYEIKLTRLRKEPVVSDNDESEDESEMGEMGLPAFSVDLLDNAKRIQRAFCTRVMATKTLPELLPDGQERHVLIDFDGSLEALWALGEKFAAFLQNKPVAVGDQIVHKRYHK